MGRKSSAKAHAAPPPPPPPKRSSTKPVAAAAVAIAVLAGGAAYWRQAQQPDEVAANTVAPVPADLKAHPQPVLPPLEFPAYAPPRPPDVIRAAYRFAAEHPEVLSYVPCFCGCERTGHRGNEDCFVRTRDVNGDVIEWDPHGMECTVCLDVATRAKQLFDAGTPVAEIRKAVDKEWAGRSTNQTPTPHPPEHSH